MHLHICICWCCIIILIPAARETEDSGGGERQFWTANEGTYVHVAPAIDNPELHVHVIPTYNIISSDHIL